MDTIGNFGIAQVEDDMEQQVYDARGNGDGKTANTITGDHADRVTDFTPLCVEGVDCYNHNTTGEVSKTLNSIRSDSDHTPCVMCVHGSQDPISNSEHANAVNRNNGLENCVCQYGESAGTLTERHDSSPCPDRGQNVVTSHLSVRRLLPVECERLMGMPDNWTKIPWRGKPADECPDAPRYKACGNSMGVNCMRWIGLGIEMVEVKHQK